MLSRVVVWLVLDFRKFIGSMVVIGLERNKNRTREDYLGGYWNDFYKKVCWFELR